MPRRSLRLALVLATSLAPPLALAAPQRLVASFDDPPGDATGPGSYVPPGDVTFTDGDFDLRRFAVYTDGDDVRLEVTLGATVRRPDTTQRTNAIPLELTNGIYLQNVDVYVDSDPSPGSGASRCIPGRRVAFADGRGWETAIVLTPQPRAARAIVGEALGKAAARVLFPGPLEVHGRTIVARIPAAALGGTPTKAWGWSVQVSGARWERSYALSDRLRKKGAPDAFTLPVLGVREAWAFGGAPAGEAHPRVVDVLLPPGADQGSVLGAFDAANGDLARVPFVYEEPPPALAAGRSLPPSPPPSPPPSLAPRLLPLGPPPHLPREAAKPAADGAEEAAPTGPVLTVADVSEDVVTLAGPIIGLAPLQIGRVLARDGATAGYVAIDKVLENGVVARIVSGRENVRWGARVRFEGRTATP